MTTPTKPISQITYKEYIDPKTDKELIDEYIALENAIMGADNFNGRDLMLQDHIGIELGKRGYKRKEGSRKMKIVKVDA